MKLKIISDGTEENTKVVDQETGEELRGVTSIEWSVRPSKASGRGHEFTTRLVMEYVPIELDVDAIKKYELRNYDTIEEGDTFEDLLGALERIADTDEDTESARALRRRLENMTPGERELLTKSLPEMPTRRRET